ncbi:MAG: hypothetical protein ACE5K4_02415 [Candidatus Hydrothermarchaeota archaeon]
MEKKVEEFPEISVGERCEIKDGKIEIPKNILEALNLKDGDAVATILIPERKQVRLMKIDKELYKLRIVAKDIYDTTHKLELKLADAKVKIIHTTGFCYAKEACIWEGFLSGPDKANLEKLADDIRQVENVFKVELKAL